MAFLSPLPVFTITGVRRKPKTAEKLTPQPSLAMAPISIPRIDQTPLDFDGELLIRSASEADAKGRHYAVSIYKMDELGRRAYVPTIEYVSDVPTERSFTIAEVVEDAADVEKFFFVFEPLEHFQCEHVDSLSTEARQEFTQKLFRLYDGAVANSLGEFRGQAIDNEQKTSTNPTQT